MKLLGLTVVGFRGLARVYDFDLSADVVLVSGPNGAGKTSLFDSILWALTGSIERLGSDADVVSKYSEMGEAKVEVRLESASGEKVRATRRCQSEATSSSLALDVGAEHFTGEGAELRLMELLWPDGAASSDPARSLTRSLTRAVYLQQDQVRSFIEDENENGRFDIVGEIVGTGRVAELVRQLELARKAWTTATNHERERTLQPLTRRRTQLIASIDAARGQVHSDQLLESDWTAWMADVSAFVGPSFAESKSSDQQRSQRLGGALDLLKSLAQQAGFELTRFRELTQRIEQLPDPVEGRAEAQEQADAASALMAQREVELSEANEDAAAVRQQMVELTEARDSLAALARLALAHIHGDCPVCGQPHEEALTADRLDQMIAEAASPLLEPSTGIAEAAEALRLADSDRAARQASLSQLDRLEAARADSLEDVTRIADSLHVAGSTPELAEHCRVQTAALQSRIAEASTLRRDGEALAATLARVAEAERALQIEAELPQLEIDIEALENRLALRDRAGEDAKRLHEALRTQSENLVSSKLEIIEPLLQRIYTSVDPHPSFRTVRFLTETVRARGRLRTAIEDRTHDLSDLDPAIVLSSSQLNVLAVVTFMALNLSATALPLELAALDDPLRSLDNVNLLGLADLLRRSRAKRQLIVSTHDDRLAGLLERKLRPVGTHQRTTVLNFDGWEPEGPVVTVRDVVADDAVRRLQAVS